MSKKPIVHLICTAHLDPIWKWGWEEGAREAVSTFATAVKMLEDFPEFIFNHNESLLYEWVEEYDPPLFERIRELVKAGRWNITGGWYLQPDVNLPGGETLARCILEGRRYFTEKFDVRPPVAYNFDTFGHGNGLPQLMSQSGFDMYMHGRPYARHLELPAPLYHWQGVDGTKMLTLRPEGVWYMAPNHEFTGEIMWAMDQAHIGIENARRDGRDALVTWGLGDHGGGATREDLLAFRELIEQMRDSDIEIRHSTPEAYLARVREQGSDTTAPTYEGEIQRVLAGCYTSVAPLKRKMRAVESLMASAERWAAAAWWRYGIKYPAADLREAWKRVMLNAFHDVLPGSLIEGAMPGVEDMFGYAGDVARRITVNRQHAMLPNVEPTPDTIAIFILNPHAHAMKAPIGINFLRAYVGALSKGDFALYDDTGEQVPHQESGGSPILEGNAMQPFLGFAADVPAMSARRYEIRFENSPVKVPNAPTFTEDANGITVENTAWRATFSAERGGLVQLSDKVAGRDLLKGAVGVQAMADTAHAWGGMERAVFNEPVGEFVPMTPAELGAYVGVEEDTTSGRPVRVIHHGPVSVTVECLTVWQHTRASICYTFYADLPHIDIDVRLFMQARQKMLKLVLPFDLPEVSAFCETPYGATARTADATEHAYHRWLRLGSEYVTVALANNGQAGFDVDVSGLLNLSLTRGAVYSSWDAPLDPNRFYTFMDQSQIDTRFRLIAGTDADEVTRQVIPLAHELNHPLEAFFAYHPASLPEGAPAAPPPFVEVSPSTVTIGALKQSEDGEALVLRLVETAGESVTATVTLDGEAAQSVDFTPYQIHNWRIHRQGETVVWTPCNLLEEPENG